MSEKISISTPLVSCEWLRERLDAQNLLLLDCSMGTPGATADLNDTTNELTIPNAIFLDIKNSFSQEDARFPNTLLKPEKFSKAARELSINQDSAIVVFDNKGIYSSPRVWWMFRAMGHKNIAVLDGGLPAWKVKGYPLSKKKTSSLKKGNFKAVYDSNFFTDYQYILKDLDIKEKLIIDARSADRFLAFKEEPRKGLRAGHIPGSKNLPFEQLLNKFNLKSAKELQTIFTALNNKEQPLVFSCGSGITACILALGAEVAGQNQLSVYDGSWTEWGSLSDLPIEK